MFAAIGRKVRLAPSLNQDSSGFSGPINSRAADSPASWVMDSNSLRTADEGRGRMRDALGATARPDLASFFNFFSDDDI
ncbi:hypothetical protein SAMN04488540_104130 [Ferrimonas sediminum]|uniref:Uncharacterized protein n=1 Tax=Ferrimonas sediminum TaxID=718193 RepID=A0A1G8PYR3_9GAMM|nr:hypothetical protein SAMN04488540_104130 [Ferrimonas sediminum]